MKIIKYIGLLLFIFVNLISCTKNNDSENQQEENGVMKLNIQINEYNFILDLESNQTVEELIDMLAKEPIRLELKDYGGFEKVGSLGATLTRNDSQMMTYPGDVVLYQGNQIVMFYDSNSWRYTKIGHVSDLANWDEALGDGDIEAVISLVGE